VFRLAIFKVAWVRDIAGPGRPTSARRNWSCKKPVHGIDRSARPASGQQQIATLDEHHTFLRVELCKIEFRKNPRGQRARTDDNGVLARLRLCVGNLELRSGDQAQGCWSVRARADFSASVAPACCTITQAGLPFLLMEKSAREQTGKRARQMINQQFFIGTKCRVPSGESRVPSVASTLALSPIQLREQFPALKPPMDDANQNCSCRYSNSCLRYRGHLLDRRAGSGHSRSRPQRRHPPQPCKSLPDP